MATDDLCLFTKVQHHTCTKLQTRRIFLHEARQYQGFLAGLLEIVQLKSSNHYNNTIWRHEQMKLVTQQMKEDSTSGQRGSGEPDKMRISTSESPILLLRQRWKCRYYHYMIVMKKKRKRKYNHRVMTVEQGTFTPLVFTVFGTAAPECPAFLKHLCVKNADNRQET